MDLKSDLFTYDIDAKALARAQMMDGKLPLVTNVADHQSAEIVDRYKSLADIERGFKVLKSEMSINQGVLITGISTITREQASTLAALNVKNPNPDPQLSPL